MTLPTLPEFEALSLEEREALFVAWVKEQPPEHPYRYADIKNCPLAQFGRAIQGAPSQASSYYFRRSTGFKEPVETLKRHGKTANRLFTHTTFGDLAQSLS